MNYVGLGVARCQAMAPVTILAIGTIAISLTADSSAHALSPAVVADSTIEPIGTLGITFT